MHKITPKLQQLSPYWETIRDLRFSEQVYLAVIAQLPLYIIGVAVVATIFGRVDLAVVLFLLALVTVLYVIKWIKVRVVVKAFQVFATATEKAYQENVLPLTESVNKLTIALTEATTIVNKLTTEKTALLKLIKKVDKTILKRSGIHIFTNEEKLPN